MQRDKKGRFIKKAQQGIKIIDGKKYNIKDGALQAYDTFKINNPNVTFDQWIINQGKTDWLELDKLHTDASYSFNNPTSSFSLNSGFSTSYDPLQYKLSMTDVSSKINKMEDYDFRTSLQNQLQRIQALDSLQILNPESKITSRIKVIKNANGKYYDEFGREISELELLTNSHRYERDFNNMRQEVLHFEENKEKPDSNGMNIFNSTSNQKNNFKPINKTRLADFLDMTRAGIGASVNNKIAKRALESEKPFLQDVSESHHNIYGDYRAKIQGEQAAARLRNAASKPLTSDGALQLQMMLDAQIKGQQFIDQGNAQDEAIIKLTRDLAWAQEKENQQLRQAAAMQNRQAMLMSQQNKTNILNQRDSANYSQVVSPLLQGIEQRLRNKGAELDYYQDHYNNAMIASNVWSNFSDGLSASLLEMRLKYLEGGNDGINTFIGGDTNKQNEWNQLYQIMQNEILRRQALQRGVFINPTTFRPSNLYGIFNTNLSLYNKKGGTIYKAKLTKRTKDNDRASKSIESSKKLAARLLEKAIDSLYRYTDVDIVTKPKKKKKYQAGGGLPFVSHTPVFATSEKGAPTGAAASGKTEDLTSEDVLELLKDMDGLPSDMQVIVASLRNFSMQDKMDPLGLSASSDMASRYISLINKIKVAKFNRDEYNNAFNQLKGNGGLHELAITSEGMLIGTNAEGDFEYFTAEEASKGKHTDEGYQLLTNSNLLHIRANSLDAAFNHKLTTVAQNGIGIETVNKLITDAIANMGTNQDSEEGYVKTKQGDLIKGLQDFYQAIEASGGLFNGTINDLYKYKYLTKSQAEQAAKAMQYIYQTLPNTAKTLLKVKSDGSDNGAVKLIETLISSKISTTTQFDIDLKGGPSHKKTGDGSKDDSDLKTSLPLMVLKAIGGSETYLDIDRGDGIHMSVRGTQYNLITSPNGEHIMDVSIAEMLGKSGLQGIVKDMNSIQFGDQKVSPETLSKITYNNTGITRANLPINPDGSVNLELLEKYEKAEKEIDISSDKSAEKRMEIYKKYEITDLLNADGSYKQSKFAPFMVTEGYTTDALSGLKTSKFVKEFKGDENAAVDIIQRSLMTGTGKNTKVPDIDTFGWYNPADWFGWTDTIYKGVLYIPIDNNVNSAVHGANQSIDYDEALIQEEKYLNFDKMSNQRSTNADILNI